MIFSVNKGSRFKTWGNLFELLILNWRRFLHIEEKQNFMWVLNKEKPGYYYYYILDCEATGESFCLRLIKESILLPTQHKKKLSEGGIPRKLPVKSRFCAQLWYFYYQRKPNACKSDRRLSLPSSMKVLIRTNFEMTNTGGTTAPFAYNWEGFLHQRNSGLSASVVHLGSNPQNDTKLFRTMKAKQTQLTYNLSFRAVQFSSSLAEDNENKLGVKHSAHLLQSVLYNQFPITVPLQEKQATYQVIKWFTKGICLIRNRELQDLRHATALPLPKTLLNFCLAIFILLLFLRSWQ